MFESERVRLRGLLEPDLSALHRWWIDPEIMRLQTHLAIRLDDEATNRERFATWYRPTDGGAAFSIVLRETEELVGACSLWGAEAKNRDAEMSIVIGRKELWGRGLGPEAIDLLLAYGFAELNLHRVHLVVLAFNTRAIRAYEKVGFVEEGRMRERVFRDGAWHDHVIMGMLQREFLSRTEGGDG